MPSLVAAPGRAREYVPTYLGCLTIFTLFRRCNTMKIFATHGNFERVYKMLKEIYDNLLNPEVQTDLTPAQKNFIQTYVWTIMIQDPKDSAKYIGELEQYTFILLNNQQE